MKSFNELRKIDVSEYIEKKNNLSYLSWAYAVDQLSQNDPDASWEYRFFEYQDGIQPYCRIGKTCMVFCTVKAFGRVRTAQLPVMDHRNNAISNPDSFQVNTAMQRCLAKAISLHGIGLYIYAGEDLPEQDKIDPKTIMSDLHIEQATTEAEVKDRFNKATAAGIDKKMPEYNEFVEVCKKRIAEIKATQAKQTETVI